METLYCPTCGDTLAKTTELKHFQTYPDGGNVYECECGRTLCENDFATKDKLRSYCRAYYLKSLVEKWVNQNFDNIPLSVVEKMADWNHDTLIDFIDKPSTEEQIKEFLEENTQDPDDDLEFQAEDWWVDNRESQYYPIHGTVFATTLSESFIDNFKNAGFLVMQNVPEFEDKIILGVAGCGYSFYGQHWIPLYLSIVNGEAERFEGVDYQMM